MTPVQGIKGFIQNLIGEMDEEAVVALATYIRAERYDFATLAKPLAGQNAAAHAKWIDCWSRVECMDMEGFPLWEEELHNLMQPLFGELSTIFLAYCRSISEDSAADAMEMSMDEFHDFVVDVGLETKKYKFDVMCNQFIKANATNTAQAYQERMQTATKDRISDADKSLKRKEGKKVKGTNDGKEAKKDQELVLYEFLNMLVRISFWRENPTFGNFGDKSEFVPVPAAVHKTLNEVILPKAKRDTSAQFRDVTMQDSGVKEALKTYNDKLQARDRPTAFTSHTPPLIHTPPNLTPHPLSHCRPTTRRYRAALARRSSRSTSGSACSTSRTSSASGRSSSSRPSPATSRRRSTSSAASRSSTRRPPSSTRRTTARSASANRQRRTRSTCSTMRSSRSASRAAPSTSTAR